MFTVEELLLVTVTVTGDELAPTRVFATLKVAGAKVSGDVPPPDPVPDNAANCVANEALETARLPSAAPLAVGVNVTLSLQLFFAANVPLHGVVPLPVAAKFALATNA